MATTKKEVVRESKAAPPSKREHGGENMVRKKILLAVFLLSVLCGVALWVMISRGWYQEGTSWGTTYFAKKKERTNLLSGGDRLSTKEEKCISPLFLHEVGEGVVWGPHHGTGTYTWNETTHFIHCLGLSDHMSSSFPLFPKKFVVSIPESHWNRWKSKGMIIDIQEKFPTEIHRRHCPSAYVSDMSKYLHDWKGSLSSTTRSSRWIKWYPRDRVERFRFTPTMVKTRTVSPSSEGSTTPTILMLLNSSRHFPPECFQKDTLPFSAKKPILFWRGHATGSGFANVPPRSANRYALFQEMEERKWISSSFCDIFFVRTAKLPSSIPVHWSQEGKKSIDQAREYKYLLSVEGNDVASNLKWALLSNSVVLMPRPTVDSWICESQLQPYIHYIPLENDFHDLDSQWKWCESHPALCQEIIENAHAYMRPFLNEPFTLRQHRRLLDWYQEHIEWNILPSSTSTALDQEEESKWDEY